MGVGVGVRAMATAHREFEIELRDDVFDPDSTDGHNNAHSAGEAGPSPNLPGSFYRFRNAGNLSFAAGIVTGITTYCWGILPAWAGFLVGAFSVSVAVAIIQAKNDARRSARHATGNR
jgi:hypothetical protein